MQIGMYVQFIVCCGKPKWRWCFTAMSRLYSLQSFSWLQKWTSCFIFGRRVALQCRTLPLSGPGRLCSFWRALPSLLHVTFVGLTDNKHTLICSCLSVAKNGCTESSQSWNFRSDGSFCGRKFWHASNSRMATYLQHEGPFLRWM